jgi:hypothetical protein
MNMKGLISSLLVEKGTALDTKPVADLACVNDFYNIITFFFLIFMPGFIAKYTVQTCIEVPFIWPGFECILYYLCNFILISGCLAFMNIFHCRCLSYIPTDFLVCAGQSICIQQDKHVCGIQLKIFGS